MMSVEHGGIVCNTGLLGKVYEWDDHHLRPLKGAVYDFTDIREACEALQSSM